MIGKTLGHYKVLEKLGRGGMGEVYVAEDTKLGRKVALKTLPSHLADSDELRQRFEREAKAIAALNHPNIVTIHSVEEAEGVHFITMELIGGKTLTELIPGQGFALNKFLDLTIPLTDAVAAAHDQGITHRDLKPDNIMVSDEGRVKILDFGLAKLKPEVFPSSSDSSNLPTEHMTQEGRIMGTVAYMSPEQAEGKTVDHRSDIFSLGTVLYVMATGEKPFKGDSPGTILSSILRDTPTTITGLNPELPRELSRLVKRCLVKDPEHRYQSSKDLRNELEELQQEVASGEVLEGARPTARPGAQWRTFVIVAGVAALAAIAGYLLRPSGVSELKTREGSFTQLTSGAGEELFPTLSPDGRFVAYVSQEAGNEDIYLLRVGGENPINLTKGSTGDDTQPSFSPDGELIAFRSDRDSGGIFVMGATGESVRRVSDVGFNPVWSPDGTEIACATEGIYDAGGRSTTSKLWALNVATGEKRIVTEGDAVQPSWSPNGHRIAYWAIEGGVRDIWTLPAGGGDAVAVTEDAHVDWNPVWSPDGSFLYFSSDRGGSMNLWRVPIDEESGEVLGDPSPVTTGASAEHAHLSFSADGGRMAYVESVARSNLQEVSFDPSEGSVGSPVPITRGSNAYGSPDVSTDGQWLVFDSRGGQEDIFVSRTDGTDRRQLSNDIHKDRIPRWSPDGSRIAFYSNRSGSYEIWTIRPDGSGLQQLTEMPEVSANYPVWSPDGSRMTYRARHLGNSYILDPNKPWEEQTPEALPLLSDAGEYLIVFSWSPDGRWLAGWTAGGDRAGIAVFSLETREFQKLTDFGAWPQWLGDSRRLLFQAQGKILILDSGSKEYRELLAIPGTFISAPAVSKDGRTIYFTLAEFESDIWLMTVE